MKTHTVNLINNVKARKNYLWTFFVFFIVATQAQVQNNGSLFIGDGTTFYVASGNFGFGLGGATETTRTTRYGKLILAAAATTSGATEAHFLNGYGSIRSTNSFTFPIGHLGVYAPIKVTSTSSSAVDAAYIRATASAVSTLLDPALGAISTVEYWTIKGTNNASISLSWRASSNLAVIGVTNAMDNLSIVGYDGSTWVKIPSTVDATSFLNNTSAITAGSISTSGTVNLNGFQFFTLGRVLQDCDALITSSAIIKTWNGFSWSPSAPTAADPVVIASNYSAGSFSCFSLQLDANIILSDAQSIEIENQCTGPGCIIMSSTASVVQRANGAVGPCIELTKKTRPFMKQFDWIYWGTPINKDFIGQLADAKASTAVVAGAFDLLRKYVSGPGGGWRNLTAIENGRGFATRIKDQAPFATALSTDFINLKFTGIANNGDISVAVTRDPDWPNRGISHVLLANPYPSALDAAKFIVENNDIGGALYIWSAATANNGLSDYTQADYIVYSLAGTVVTNPLMSSFSGKIASAQGFFVKSLVNNGNVSFTNCMRLTTDNNQFNKVKSPTIAETKDSYKLNMTGKNGVFSQILVSYFLGATVGYDRLYDAGRNSVSSAQLFSILETDGSSLAINARPLFEATDVVSLGVSISGTNPQEFTIALVDKTGIFTTADQSVYIHDTANNTFHDLNNGDFIFTTDRTVLDRFKVVYTARTLSNPEFESNQVIATLRHNSILLKSAVPLTGIEVYELTGKKILSAIINNALSSSTAFVFPQGVYVVKATLNNGTVASFKLINMK